MILEAGKLLLRTVSHDDIDEVARTWNLKNGGVTKVEAADAIIRMKEHRSKNKIYKFFHICLAVFEKGSNRIIGWCGLDGREGGSKPYQPAEIFYMIDEAYRKNGYGTLCAKKLLEYGFLEMKINRINGSCSKNNIASRRILEKIGMKNLTFSNKGDPRYHLTQEEYQEL